MKRLLAILLILFGGTYLSAQTDYLLNEGDSTLKLKEPVPLKPEEENSSLFNIRLREKIKNHVWFISFQITNNTEEDLSVVLGSEGHLEVVTPAVVIKSGATELIRYKMRKEKYWAGFTQMGKITVYSKQKEKSEFDLYRSDLSGYFSITGEWVY
jgi:hypothetical protein